MLTRTVVVVVVLVLGISGLSWDDLRASELEGKLDAYLEPLVARNDFAGVVLLARDGKVLVEKAYGFANLEHEVAHTPDSRFRIASLSKQFTAAAIMLLREQGGLRLEDPIARFLPDFPRGGDITIHHLLTHTSGVPHDIPGDDQPEKRVWTADSLAARIGQADLLFEPGSKDTYSSAGYALLAAIIERASGQEFGEFMREAIFAPLGMHATGHERSDALLEHRASGYVPAPDGALHNAPHEDMSYLMGGGSLYSTARDLLAWDRALRSEKLLKRTSLDVLIGRGYGIGSNERFGRRRLGFDGRLDGFISFMENYLDDDATVILLSNISVGSLDRLRNDISAILFGEEYSLPTRPPLATNVDPDLFTRYAGDYELFPGFVLSFTVRGEHLYVNGAVMDPESGETFFFRPRYARVQFMPANADGEVDELVWEEYPAHSWKGRRVQR